MAKVKTIKTQVVNTPKYDYFRMVVCAVLACAALLFAFSLHTETIPDVVEKLTKDHESPNLEWFFDHIAASIPVLFAVITMCIVYRDKSRYVPVYTQREKLFISLTLAIVTLIMFAYISFTDGEVKVGDEYESMLEKTATWFAAQIIPLVVLISYHSIRSGSEKAELEEEIA